MRAFKKLFLNLFVASSLLVQTVAATTVQLVTLRKGTQRVHVFFDTHGYDSEPEMLEKLEHLKKNLSAGSYNIDVLVEGRYFKDSPFSIFEVEEVLESVIKKSFGSNVILYSEPRLVKMLDSFLAQEGCSELAHLNTENVMPYSYLLQGGIFHGVFSFLMGKFSPLRHEENRSVVDILGDDRMTELAAISLKKLENIISQDTDALRFMLAHYQLPISLQRTFRVIARDVEKQVRVWCAALQRAGFSYDQAMHKPLFQLLVEAFQAEHLKVYQPKMMAIRSILDFLSMKSSEATKEPFGLGNMLECNAFFHIISEHCANTVAAFMGVDHARFLVSFLEQAGYIQDPDFTIAVNDKVLSDSEESLKAMFDRMLISLPKEIYNVLNTDPEQLRKIGIEFEDVVEAELINACTSSSVQRAKKIKRQRTC
ncbi:hypothetical protein K2X40_02370 [Candidatus Babeliales bacterium]|nr:hypothetical protein [Candidatus Babeliales bacterium]